MSRIRIATAKEVKEGKTVKFSFTRDDRPQEGFVGRFKGELFAYDNTCRHLPLCIGFIWVNDRFAAEPISPGSRFTFTAFVEPSQLNAAGRLRYARLDAAEGLRVLGSSYRRLESNPATPAISPYRVAWEVEALAAGTHGLSVNAAGEKVRKEVLVSVGLERAPAIGRYGGGLREVHVDHAPLLVGLPGGLHEWLSAAAAFFNGGRGLLPAQTAVGPWTAYLVLAVLAMLALQRLTGYR